MIQPDYRFTLITNTPLITSLGQVGAPWTDLGGTAPWVNTPPTINNTASSITTSNVLSRPLAIVAGREYIVTLNYTATRQSQLIISTGPGQNVYLLNAPSSGVPKLLRFTFKGYSNSGQFIQIQIVNSTTSVIFNLNTLRVEEVGTLQRVIQPGGWKTLSKLNERLLNLWGFSETLEGAIEIFGEDFEWLKNLLRGEPDKQFYCKVDIDNAGVIEQYFLGLLDTTQLLTVGIEHTYKAAFSFLKESAWSEFVTHMETPINSVSNQGVFMQDVIDSRISKRIFPGGDIWPRLRYRYSGAVTFTPNATLTADAVINIGFGELITINDGFESFIGVGQNQSISVPFGKMRALQGSVRVSWTAPAQIVVEAAINDSGGWIALGNGVDTPILLTEAYLIAGISGWSVRVRNTSGATQTYKINASTLIINNAQVEYELTPASRAPLLTMKAYTARIMGEYDNLRAPIFEDTMGMSAGGLNDLALQDPPPRFRPYNALVGSGLPPGNYFAGGTINWTRLTAPNRFSWAGGGLGNVLLFRAVATSLLAFGYSTYFTKGSFTVNISGVVGVAGMLVDVVGLLDGELTVLGTFAPAGVPASNLSLTVNIDKYYEGVGLRPQAGSTAFTIQTFSMVYATIHNVVRGKYAMNYLTNGAAIKVNSGAPDTESTSLFLDFGQVFNGLVKMFSLAIEPEINSQGKTRIYMDEVANFFLSGFGSYMYAEEFTIEMDQTLLADSIKVGGPANAETTMDKESSCAKSEYATAFVTTKRKQDLEFGLCLNPSMILNQDLGTDEIALLELSSNDLPTNGDNTRYRTTTGLTITGTQSPRQPNWLHSEGRILRRNNAIISSMGTPYFYMIAAISSPQVQVDAGDGLGAVSDADPIVATPLFTPWLIKFETELTLLEEKQLIVNRKLVQRVNIHGVERAFYLKAAMANRATGRATITGWLKASGDFSLDFSEDFEVTPLPVEI